MRYRSKPRIQRTQRRSSTPTSSQRPLQCSPRLGRNNIQSQRVRDVPTDARTRKSYWRNHPKDETLLQRRRSNPRPGRRLHLRKRLGQPHPQIPHILRNQGRNDFDRSCRSRWTCHHRWNPPDVRCLRRRGHSTTDAKT